MSSTMANLMLRASIVLGMSAAVMTILYFTPIPEQNFKSCDRPCHELDWPMICRFKLNIERYNNLKESCTECQKNSTNCETSYCTSEEGDIQDLVTANHLLPGPSIQVCQNDILVIDVVNNIPGHTLSVHWRGQPNHEAPHMDGATMITQCPINSYSTFQYKFRASASGTHLYHAYSDGDRNDGLFGALIVRQPDQLEPHKKLYDYDDKNHVIVISEGTSEKKSLLVNGFQDQNSSNFLVEPNKRYRFRVIYAQNSESCPVELSIDSHLMKVISLDGKPTSVYEASSVILSKGERLDFILKTNQNPSLYDIKVQSKCKNLVQGKGLLSYKGVKITKQIKSVNFDSSERVLDTSLCDSKLGRVCLNQIKSLAKLPKELSEDLVDRRIYLAFNSVPAVVREGHRRRASPTNLYSINNLTFTYPPSPLLSQPDDIPTNILCNDLNIPRKCDNRRICECVHIEHIPLRASAEIILLDQDGQEEEHVFHLHGYHFYVVALRQFNEPISVEELKKLDSENRLFKRNLDNAVLKDTVRVPRFGAVAVRFIATNPGFWVLRDENSKGYTRGLDMVLQVGDVNDVASAPSSFPTCGNFIGPDFFLI